MQRSHILKSGGILPGLNFQEYQESTTDVVANTPVTFSDVEFGSYSANREIFIAVCWSGNRSGSVEATIGGESASLILQRSFDTTTSANVAFFRASPTGNVGDIVITNPTRTMYWVSVAAYSGLSFDQIAQVDSTTTGSNMTLTGPEYGCAVYAAATGLTGGSSFNLSGSVSSDADVNVESSGRNDQYGFASAPILAEGTYTVTSSASHVVQARGAVRLAPKHPITLIDSDLQNFTAAGTQVFSLPSMEENDIVVLIGGDDPVAGTSSFGTAVASGWTSIENGTDPSDNYSYIAAYKIMGSSPDTTIDVGDFATSGSARGTYAIAVFRGVDTSNPLDVAAEVLIVADGNDGNLSPPDITPVTNKAVVFIAGLVKQPENVGTSYPFGYTGLENNLATGNVTLKTAYKKAYAAALQNPGILIFDTDEKACRLYSIALRPA